MPANRKMQKTKKIVAVITCGDAAGIGCEVVFKALRHFPVGKTANFLVIGDWVPTEFTLRKCKLNLKLRVIEDEREADFKKSEINFIDAGLIKRFSLEDAGKINVLFGKASIEYIKTAYSLIKRGKADCLVTAPLNKKAVCLSHKNFTGHTEFLAGLSRTKETAMMLTGEKLRVVLVTRHIPLKKVSSLVTERKILSNIKLTDDYLRHFCNFKNPRIALCALNPHAGDGGIFGMEEKVIIEPAAKKALKRKVNLIGPLPADSVFEKAYRGQFDAVICLYHDQGLIPLKMVEREKAVNITLGLPFIRTSPAHGTAYDIAYQNRADSSSFYFAVEKAVEMAENTQ